MRSTKAFLIGAGAAVILGRLLGRRRNEAPTVGADDATIAHRVLGEALPAAGVSADHVAVEVDRGVVTLQGSVDGSDRADALIERVADVPGVRDVAAMLRVSERRAA